MIAVVDVRLSVIESLVEYNMKVVLCSVDLNSTLDDSEV